METGARIVVACHDLMWRGKVESTLRHMGLASRALGRSEDATSIFAAARPAAIIVDLGMGSEAWRRVVTAARALDPPVPLLAFGPHVDRAAQTAARAAGCDVVVANSRLARELPALVERLLTVGVARRETGTEAPGSSG